MNVRLAVIHSKKNNVANYTGMDHETNKDIDCQWLWHTQE